MSALMRTIACSTMLVAASMAGCADFDHAEVTGGAGFDHLYNRKLSAFEQRLAASDYAGRTDAWTKLGRVWLDFVNCQPTGDREVANDGRSGEAAVAGFLAATVQLADRRRRLKRAEVSADGRRRAWQRERTLGEAVQATDFFDREPGDGSSRQVRWPSDEEHWPDELPAPITVEGACEEMSVSGDVDEQQRKYLRAVDRVEAAWEALPDEARRGGLEALYGRIRWSVGAASFQYATRRAIQGKRGEQSVSDDVDQRDVALTRDAWEQRARTYLEPFVGDNAKWPEDMAETRRAETQLMATVLMLRRSGGEFERADRRAALRRLRRALEMGLENGNRWAARYLVLREQNRLGEWEASAKLASSGPPATSPVYEAYIYRSAVALEQAGRDEAFVGLIKRVFRQHDASDDPFLEALHGRAMRHLAAYPFDQRIVEVLEEMGPRDELYGRVEAYARAAIGRGHTEAAEDAGEWLLRYHSDARARPRYRALLALVAFQRDNVDAFRRQIDEIARRPDALTEAIPPGRRASFFAPSDAALTRILRSTLPMMAEWGETPAAERRRERWLTIIVEEVQQFLRTTEESVARPALEEMYRLASEQLANHPRGYAERVGGEGPSTLVLGTVTVSREDLSSVEPVIGVTVEMPYSLTLVPRGDKPPFEWPERWPADSTGGPKDGQQDGRRVGQREDA